MQKVYRRERVVLKLILGYTDLPELPVYGQLFGIDDKQYLVESCADDMGVLTIQLVANDR